MPQVKGRGGCDPSKSMQLDLATQQQQRDHARCASDSSSEDDDADEADLGAGIFEAYLAACDAGTVDADTDAVFARGLLRVQDYLSAGKDSTSCLICLGSIKATEAIWSCAAGCFALFHLPCIQEWARNQLGSGSGASREWGCPKCRAPGREVPDAYTCYCGKQAEPAWDPWLAPHSCGELCGKPLPGRCEHSCLLLCHPGPCPPCPLLVDAACYCGKARMKLRCGRNEFSCKAICGRTLPCGHACPETCHAGRCPPCQVPGVHACACGAQTARLPCCQAEWHCAKPCGKRLACGRHACEQVCHAGCCGSCPQEGERHCPCGKTLYAGLSCDEKAPACGGTCGKVLACGVHTCHERCHHGPCSTTCRELVDKTCRCGRTTKLVLCSTDVRCDSKCSGTRACGRHMCRRRCCDGNCPPCEEVCNRKLRCGNHKCQAPCHAGPCRPCPLQQAVACACGATAYSLPCGAEGLAAPPRCTQPCRVRGTCRHAAAAKAHRCHFGPCPPCRSACGEQLPCGHACAAGSCHDAPPPAVAAFQQPKPPLTQAQAAAAAAAAAKRAAASGEPACTEQPPALVAAGLAAALLASGHGRQPCPPCSSPVVSSCLGGHCQQARPCHAAGPFSCGAPCGRPLACCNHSCSKPCHALGGAGAQHASGPAGAAGAAAGAACEACSRPCSKPRACSHPCEQPCHPGSCKPCSQPCSVPCHCAKTTLSFSCSEHQALLAKQQQKQQRGGKAAAGGPDPLSCNKPCFRQLPHCPHPCRQPCHAGPCGPCGEEVAVRCACRRLKQRWPCGKVQAALAAAGTSSAYDGVSALKLLPCDSECRAAAAAAAGRNGASRVSSPECEGSQSVQQQTCHAAAAAQAQAAAPPGQPTQPGSRGSKKLTRAEREAAAAVREAARLAQERRAAVRRGVLIVAVLALVAACLWGLGAVLRAVLLRLDAWLLAPPDEL